MKETSNNQQYNYIISNYNKYNLNISSKADMLILINKLEAYGETLDSLHDCDGDMDGFCGLVVTGANEYLTDSEIANAIDETNAFFESKEQYLEWTEAEGDGLIFLSDFWDEQFESSVIVKTTDGYVELSVI